MQHEDVLIILQERFHKNTHRHPGLEWSVVQERLVAHPERLWTLSELECAGGEPDVVCNPHCGEAITFMDCAAESPKERRSLCYDDAARNARKENKPTGSVIAACNAMKAQLLTEEQYRTLQRVEQVDQKTSSWLLTPANIRALGGAIFGDRRYNTVFIFHNGADSYYSSRGFRCAVQL